MFRSLVLSLIVFFQVVSSFAQSAKSEYIPYYPSNHARMVAEWEPAIGVLISWPPSIPHKLIIELAKDTKLYMLVENRESIQDAIVWLSKWNIMPDRVKFITAPQGIDVSWTRDWGPHAVFTPEGELVLADGKYLYATPVSGLACDDTLQFLYRDANNEIELTKTDDVIPRYISGSIDMEMVNLPFAFTGGNVFSDGQRSAFSSCVLLNENSFAGVTEEQFSNDARRILGIENYNILSNFEDRGIQHIDCFMKLLDEERILVMRPPADHPASEQYEGIVKHELSKLTNAYGRSYQILRLDTDVYHDGELAAYSNSLILNKVIYVPLFGIPQDGIALKQWADAMPGYTIKGFEFVVGKEPRLRDQVFELYDEIGWTGGDALHCRTRAIWDPTMIYISVDRVPANVAKASSYPISVIIKDYSKGGLMTETLKVMWRVKGRNEWKELILTPSDIPDHFKAAFPGGQAGVTIEYYITAKSFWGTIATMPRTAPEGVYEFKID